MSTHPRPTITIKIQESGEADSTTSADATQHKIRRLCVLAAACAVLAWRPTRFLLVEVAAYLVEHPVALAVATVATAALMYVVHRARRAAGQDDNPGPR